MAFAMLLAGAACHAGEALVEPGAELVKLHGGFKFTEGPAEDADGNVFFSDIPNRKVHKWSTDGKLTTFRADSGGSNGLMFDKDGNLIACEGAMRRVTSTSPAGKVTVLADSFAGKKLNSPNDLWIDAKGGIYFTDPRYGRGAPLEQDGMHVYYIKPDGKTVTRVADDLERPNGIIGSKDGKTLYITDEKGGKTYRYDIKPDATLDNKKLFAPQGSDGMTLDEHGNLYLTLGPVTIYSPDGKKLKTIDVPERVANVCFGGKDRKTLFITAKKSLYSLRMNVRGQ